MKKLISLVLSAAFILSVCAISAPALAVSPVLPDTVNDAEVVYDPVAAVVRGLAVGATAGDVAAQFDGEVEVLSYSGDALAADAAIGTAYVVRGGDAAARIAVYGDLNGDAKSNARDVVSLMTGLVSGGFDLTASGEMTEKQVAALAADGVPDGVINAKDVLALMKYLVGYDVILGERFLRVHTEAQSAEAEDASLDLFFEDSLAKEGPKSTVRTTERTFVLRLARNEKESCQAILFSDAGHTGLRASLTPFANGKGETLDSQLLYEDYITLTASKSVVPDRLPPIEAIGAFKVNANERQGLYIEVSANEQTKAGLYRARLDITDESGAVIKTAYVYADIWDFTIPVESHVKTAVGMGYFDGYNRRTRDSEKDVAEHYIEYYEYFLNNRINPWNMPYAPWDERADEWMDDPRVNTFLVGGGYGGDVYSPYATDENIIATYAKLSQNEKWLSKAMFYYTDEPGVYWDQEEVNKTTNMMEVKSKLDNIFPGARTIVPSHINFWQDQGLAHFGHRTMLDIVGEYATVPCPKIEIFIPRADCKRGMQPSYNNGYWEIDDTTEVEDTYGTLYDMLARWKAAGKETWWYNVTDYGDAEHSLASSMVNVSLNDLGMQTRMLWWLGEKYGMEGWLLWTVCEWTSKKRSSLDDKNGVLVYPGDDFNVDGPIACRRTGIIRDGIEDVEYLYLARDLIGEDAVNEYINALVTDVLRYETDSARFAALREELGDRIEAATRDFKIETKAQKASWEDSKLDLFFEDSLAKNNAQSTEKTDERTFVMKLARNEKESCQAILFSETGHEGLNATLTPFTNKEGDTLEGQLLFENYMKIVDDKKNEVMDPVPDCLPPIDAVGAFKINEGERQGLYIEVGAGENAPAGLYRARLDITDAKGRTVKTAYVYAEVWDFAIPVESSFKTAVGMGAYGIALRNNRSTGMTDAELYEAYYEYLLDERINAWCLPYDPITNEADRWMDDPRVNTFLVAGGYSGDGYNNMTSLDDGTAGNVIDEEKVAAIYDKIKDNEAWMSKALFYCTDEPGILSVYPDRDKFAEAFAQKEQLDRCFPGARIIIPGSSNEWQDQLGDKFGWGHVDAMELTAQCSNVLCPKIDIYFPTGATGAVYGAENETMYGTYESRTEKWRAEGKEIWWYTENAPWEPNLNISQRHTGMENRMTFWASYKYDIEGFLYWTVTDWGPKKRNMIDRYAGVLVYPGDEWGIAGPVACQRAGIMRDGIEDMEYLYLAEELLGKDKANEYLAQLVTDVVTFSEDSRALYEVRAALGDAIEAAVNAD